MQDDLNLLVGLEGRIDRSSWWSVRIVGFCVLAALGVIFYFLTLPEMPGHSIFKSVSALICAIATWVDLATTVKRWHDRGRPGWMYFIVFIPIVGPIWTLVECGFLPGEPGPNRFGPSPADSPSGDAVPVAG